MGVRGPGLIFVIPIFEMMIKINIKGQFDVPPQKVMTQDEKTARVSAVINYRVTDPEKAVTQVESYHLATSKIAIETLKDLATQTKLLEIHKVEFKKRLHRIINEKTNPFGIEVSEVEIKDVDYQMHGVRLKIKNSRLQIRILSNLALTFI